MHIKLPTEGTYITSTADNKLDVPDFPIIPFIEGDGIGVDITPVMHDVVNAAVKKAYGDQKKIHWLEIYAGEKANTKYSGNWLPDETLEVIRKCCVAIKGPLTTPVGGGMRSLNVAIRQKLDLYICLRPIRYFKGTPSPIVSPEKVDMVIFRENSEDIYAGIEWEAGSKEAQRVIQFLQTEMNVQNIRFTQDCGIGIKPVSKKGTMRLVKAAIKFALENRKKSVTLVHKGNIMKYTEGAFKQWGYDIAVEEFGAKPLDGGPWHIIQRNGADDLIIKDVIADAFLQQIILRPEEYSVIATLNLNGDYISDALAAQVGGIGIAPGANIGQGTAVFEATHGTAPKYAGQDKVNPSSLILSAEMMLRHMGWSSAADNIIRGIERSIEESIVTYDLARLIENVTKVSCSEYGRAIIRLM